MAAILSLFVVLVLSLVIVRVASVALTLTGLSPQLARFQARSAYTGAGFTTTESEKVVQHPVRRRIIMLLMLLGNAGVITAVSTLMLSFMNLEESEGISGQLWFRLLLLIAGLCILWTAANSHWLDRRMRRAIQWALKRWTKLEVRDYAGLLHLTGEYVVVEMAATKGDWLAGRELSDLKLSDEGVLVLGIEKAGGGYIGAPRGNTKTEPGDTLVLYGRLDVLQELDERMAGPEGNWAHFKAMEEQRKNAAEEEEETGEAGAAKTS